MRPFPPITHETPDAVVVFIPTYLETKNSYILNHRQQNLLVYSRSTQDINKTIDASIRTITTKTQINGFGNNSFSISLVSRKDEYGYYWDEKIFPNDIIVILAKRPSIDEEYQTLMVGFVNNITKEVNIDDSGIPARIINVSGTDLTGFFNNQYIIMNSSLMAALQEIRQHLHTIGFEYSTLLSFLNEFYGPVWKIYQNFMVNYALPDMRWMITREGKTTSIMLHITTDSSSFAYESGKELNINGVAFSSANTSTTAFIDTLLQKPFNEMLIYYKNISELLTSDDDSILNGAVQTIIRPSPFYFDPNHDPLSDSLPDRCGEVLGPSILTSTSDVHVINNIGQSFTIRYHYINDESVVKESLGKDMSNIYNLFLVQPRTPFNQDITPVINSKTAFHLPSIHRFGLKPLITQTDYTAIGNSEVKGNYNKEKEEQKNKSDLLSAQLNSVMKQWFVKNGEFLTGMIEVKGTGKYRPGDVLIYDSNERQTITKLYIERVIHKFVNFQYFTTELYVSRGVITKDKRNV